MRQLEKCLKNPMAKLVDANLIIRFLLNDTPKQAKATEQLFSESKDLILTDLTVAEVVWVLTSVYNLPKEAIIQKLISILSMEIFLVDKKLLIQSLLFFRKYNISFIDAYLAALCEQNKLEGIYSFDKGFDKIKSIRRIEP